MASTYSPNGNVLPIDKRVAFLYMFLTWSKYDRFVEKGIKPSNNPYSDEIIMSTDDGKYIKIPDDLRKYAIQQWMIKKSKEDNDDSVQDR